MTNFSVYTSFCEIPQHRVLSLCWWLLCRPLLLCAVRRISRHDSKTWQGPLMQPYAHVCHVEYGLNPTTFKKVAKQCRTDKYETFRCFLLLYGVPWCFIMFDVSCEVIQRLPCPSLCSILRGMQMYHHCFWKQSFDLVHLSCVELLLDKA